MEKFSFINDELKKFILDQKIFFVATAMSDGHINLSPKGMDTLRVVNSNEVVWLNLTGSGNETAAHLQENNRMTMMFNSFEGKALILRLYGTAKLVSPKDETWDEYISLFPKYSGVRQVVIMSVNMVMTSCGYAVPKYTYEGDREALTKWSDQKGEKGVRKYWQENNVESLDGEMIKSMITEIS